MCLHNKYLPLSPMIIQPFGWVSCPFIYNHSLEIHTNKPVSITYPRKIASLVKLCAVPHNAYTRSMYNTLSQLLRNANSVQSLSIFRPFHRECEYHYAPLHARRKPPRKNPTTRWSCAALEGTTKIIHVLSSLQRGTARMSRRTWAPTLLTNMCAIILRREHCVP